MAVDLLIQGGRVVRAGAVIEADIAIDDGSIVDVAPALPDTARQFIDAGGMHVLPGVIDPHVHFNEPGRADWEGIATGSAALAAGGGTCFFDMPLNSSPPVLDASSFDAKRAAAERSSLTDFALWGGLTPGNLDRMSELAERGVVGFKAFMCASGIDEFPAVDDLTLYRGMKQARALNLPVAVHAESESIIRALLAEMPRDTPDTWAATRPILAEVEATARAILLAEETGCALHIVHVSNPRCVELVRRSEGNISCETCPHFLVLNLHDLSRLGAIAKCAPPLRSPGENDEMWQDLANGRIDFVASDHSPCPPTMKTATTFLDAWGGISGVQSTLSILLSRGPALPLARVAQVTSGAAASRFRIPRKGAIEPGFDADLALVDVPACFELKREDLMDRHRQSPYVGRTFHGRVKRTLVRGRTVFLDGEVIAEPGGRLVIPAR